jgi:hypothetical protein
MACSRLLKAQGLGAAGLPQRLAGSRPLEAFAKSADWFEQIATGFAGEVSQITQDKNA